MKVYPSFSFASVKNVDTVVVDDGRTDVVAVEEEHEVGQENVSSPRAHSLQYRVYPSPQADTCPCCIQS